VPIQEISVGVGSISPEALIFVGEGRDGIGLQNDKLGFNGLTFDFLFNLFCSCGNRFVYLKALRRSLESRPVRWREVDAGSVVKGGAPHCKAHAHAEARYASRTQEYTVKTSREYP